MSESSDEESADVTRLLREVQEGDESAKIQLLAVLCHELRATAERLMNRENAGHSLQATALINEAVLRLWGSSVWELASSREYLFGAGCRAMRQVLIDHARKRARRADGANQRREMMDDVLDQFEASSGADIEQLELALLELEQDRPRQYQVVVSRFFAGLTVKQTAELLGVSLGTIENDWRLGRARLYRRLQ